MAVEERERGTSDDVVSTAVAAAWLRRSRQSVDAGVRAGRVRGFRDPVAKRVWVERAWVEEQVPADAELSRRVGALEQLLGSSGSDIPVGTAAVEALAENVTLREMNLALIAAADASDEAAELLEAAERLEEKARRKRRKAAAAQRRAQQQLRSGLSASILPGSPASLER